MVAGGGPSVAVKPEYYNTKIDAILENFEKSVLLVPPASAKPAPNLAARMMRSQEIFQLLSEYSSHAQRDAYRGVCLVDYSCPEELFKRFQIVLTRAFEAKAQADRKEAKDEDPKNFTPAKLLSIWKELQRVTSECCSLMQFAELHDQQEKTPKNVREIVYKLFAFSWKSEILELCEQTVCSELARNRETGDQQALVIAKGTFLLRMAIADPRDRDTKIYAKIEERYIKELRAYLSKSVTIPEDVREYIISINKIIDDELERSDFVFGKGKTATTAPPSTTTTTNGGSNAKATAASSSTTTKTSIISTSAKAKLNIQQELVADRAMAIIEDQVHGVAACIKFPELRIGDFRLLFNAFEFDKASLEKMRAALAGAVKIAVEASAKKNGGKFSISETINIKSNYGNLVKSGVPASSGIDFHLAVQNGMIEAIPNNGSFEEALVSKLDSMIRSKDGLSSSSTLRSVLDSMSLVPSSELFSAHYKKALSVRLLLKRDPNFTAERKVVKELTRVRGSAFTKHFNIMIEEASKEPILCSAAVWPSGFSNRTAGRGVATSTTTAGSSSSALDNYQAPISAAFKEFVTEQQKRHPGCNIWVDSDHSVIELKFENPDISKYHCRILASTAQAQVLLAFDEAGGKDVELSEEELKPKVGAISTSALSIAIITLAGANFLIKGTSGSKKYKVNQEYMKDATSNKKVALPTVGPKRQ